MNEYCIYLRKSRADVEAEARGENGADPELLLYKKRL
jgi:hypothetical protein